jgi:hypothetical protein
MSMAPVAAAISVNQDASGATKSKIQSIASPGPAMKPSSDIDLFTTTLPVPALVSLILFLRRTWGCSRNPFRRFRAAILVFPWPSRARPMLPELAHLERTGEPVDRGEGVLEVAGQWGGGGDDDVPSLPSAHTTRPLYDPGLVRKSDHHSQRTFRSEHRAQRKHHDREPSQVIETASGPSRTSAHIAASENNLSE